MKSPLGKLRKLYKNDTASKDKRDALPSANLDELAQAAQDMHDMRNCYDSLLSAAAATANSAYEFSESLREMGSCLLEKTMLNHDEESGRVLLMLGKVQYELRKLVDSYRSHIFLTITNPSESLLNELRTVEDMKRQCDEKRNVYEYMVAQQKEKGKSKTGKGENFTLQQLKMAYDEYNEEATLCVFRLKSLRQGQSRSLLTQAARHHAAQLNFFRKGLKSLEAVEPQVRVVTEQQHINYQFSGLEDEGVEDGEDDGENDDDANEGRELSFDYRRNEQGHDVVSASRNSMEADETDLSLTQASSAGTELNPDRNRRGHQMTNRELRAGSHSAPIFPERKLDPVERLRQMQQSSARKSSTYVLPTPTDAKGTVPSRTGCPVLQAKHMELSGRAHFWHSSPLEQKKYEKDSGDALTELPSLKARSSDKETKNNNSTIQLPVPLEGRLLPHLDTSESKKIRRQSFSGPITSRPWSSKPYSSSGPISSTELPQQVAGLLSRVPIHQSSSPKVSPSASPPLASSPRISELHELPRPPGGLAAKTAKSSVPVGHSAPLARNSPPFGTSKLPATATNLASPLPTPPLVVPRSFSIPSSSQRTMTVHVSKMLESPKVHGNAEEGDSPPLTPIALANAK